jgi:hypothetical protein
MIKLNINQNINNRRRHQKVQYSQIRNFERKKITWKLWKGNLLQEKELPTGSSLVRLNWKKTLYFSLKIKGFKNARTVVSYGSVINHTVVLSLIR